MFHFLFLQGICYLLKLRQTHFAELVLMSEATLHGHYWTILNGQMVFLLDLESFMLILRMD